MHNRNFSEYEWLLTNSLGGYAMGSSSLVNRRKYHGLLIASDRGFRRTHLVSSVEEKAEAGGAAFHLDSTHYAGIVHPDGYRRVTDYFLRPEPCFIYSAPAGGGRITKTVRMHPSKNSVCVLYKNAGDSALKLTLRPKFSFRCHHSVNPPGRWDSSPHEALIRGSRGVLSSSGMQCSAEASTGSLSPEWIIYRNVSYIMEILRGYESSEDLAAPFRFDIRLEPDEEACLLFSTEDDTRGDCAAARKRYESLPAPGGHPGARKDEAFSNRRSFGYGDYLRTLESAFMDFAANDDLVAGFPWFSAWGRDTMISLEAFDHIPGSDSQRKKILLKYARSMKNGVIPNTAGEGGEGANYDTADASLWFGLRVMEFLDRLEEPEREELLGAVANIVESYSRSPELPFYMDPEDGLIALHGGTGAGLTWMDAKVHDSPVTPRYGKPVEINCLWHSLLNFCSDVRDFRIGKPGIDKILGKTSSSLMKFYGDGIFFDRLSESGAPVKEIRPNYLVGLSLPFSPFSAEETSAGYELAKKHLLTPCGLRSLSPDSPAFRSKYMGSQPMRDLAYHQGTVWVWLLLPMAKTAAALYDAEKLVKELERMVYFFRKKFMDGELASVPEIYDGDEPVSPKGAPAQCWSVTAIFVIEKMINNIIGSS